MQSRFVVIWFRHLKTDWFQRKQAALRTAVFVLAAPDHGRMMITEASFAAAAKGIVAGMVVSDAKILYPSLQVIDDVPGLHEKLLNSIALWCTRYTPVAAVDIPGGIVLDATGCTHLWGGEENYLGDIIRKLKGFGYRVRAAMADTIGAAWAIARYGKIKAIIKTGEQAEAIMQLPPAALRIQKETNGKLQKLGLSDIKSFMFMQPSVLRRRFGAGLLLRLSQALGTKEEFMQPVNAIVEYSERLPCLELIQTRTGIEIALEQLLEKLCKRLVQEGKGLREIKFTACRVDNKTISISVKTNHASANPTHIFKLLENRIAAIEPALGIELFLAEAIQVEKVRSVQQTFWTANGNAESREVAELLDNLQNKFGNNIVCRYLPAAHHWPERSVTVATSVYEKPAISWPLQKLRPIQLLQQPIPIQVTAPIPDYPPMNFRYNNKLYIVARADACERIEPEWWIEGGLHRDYYIVEDMEGKRYWIYRLGHYSDEEKPLWFIHGYFA
ncbi:DNA polymerase Y family protein [Panacibacter sp. DH6]|uniref:DNA polymerase Y family protein n=1 Tax=Panacibacter microcysteis TaxID=2793269 RepID=A0A931E565_9BACT|nr:DNA polymerase Y family protein [Panacibacter microcysteis]MBG9374619.1 DNA polymerase Y family protein [Panacibacter microcysteis]